MKSPFLKDSRLGDIVGAIQVMGVYPWASRKADDWHKSLGQPLSATDWPTIFREHPELFRFTGTGWASLRWRHGYFRTFDAKQGRELSDEERDALPRQQQEELTHRPLTADQIEALMKTALEFHARANRARAGTALVDSVPFCLAWSCTGVRWCGARRLDQIMSCHATNAPNQAMQTCG